MKTHAWLWQRSVEQNWPPTTDFNTSKTLIKLHICIVPIFSDVLVNVKDVSLLGAVSNKAANCVTSCVWYLTAILFGLTLESLILSLYLPKLFLPSVIHFKAKLHFKHRLQILRLHAVIAANIRIFLIPPSRLPLHPFVHPCTHQLCLTEFTLKAQPFF